MKESASNVQFIKVTKESVLYFLGEARKRIVIAKAGYFADEIEKLLAQAKKDVRCNLYVDTDENSVRSELLISENKPYCSDFTKAPVIINE